MSFNIDGNGPALAAGRLLVILFLDEVFNLTTGVSNGTRAACGKSMLAAGFAL